MLCPRCHREIKDAGWNMHQGMCSGPAPAVRPAPVASQPAPSPTPAPVQPEVKAVSTDLVAPVTVVDIPKDGNGSIEVFYPDADPYFVVPLNVYNALMDADKLSHKKPTCVLLTGHAGGGKTSVALQLAARTQWDGKQRPAVVADFGVVQEPQQLFQTTRLIQGKGESMVTDTRESGFIRGIETPGCVVIMDELTRVENERCLNPLMPLLDGRHKTWIDELRRRVHVAPGVIFVATINEGSLFCGITSLDAALRDRFGEVFMDYLKPEQELLVIQNKTGAPESIAKSLAQFAFVVRDTDTIERKVSTRQLLRAAEYYMVGAPLWHAVEISLGNYNDKKWRQEVMQIFSLNIFDETELKKWQQRRDSDDSFVQF